MNVKRHIEKYVSLFFAIVYIYVTFYLEQSEEFYGKLPYYYNYRRLKLCSKKSVYSLLACCCFFRLPDADDVETATYKYLKKEEFHSNYEYYLVNNKDVHTKNGI